MVIKDQIVPVLESIFCPFVSAYRERYSTQHVLIRLVEEWKTHLDKDFVVGGILMISKLATYGFNDSVLQCVISYLKDRKQCVKLNNVYSSFRKIISGVPQGSVLDPILFNIFINDFFYSIENVSIHNFADDNTFSAFARTSQELLEILKNESELAVKWFIQNEMIVNSDKFKTIFLSKNNTIDIL